MVSLKLHELQVDRSFFFHVGTTWSNPGQPQFILQVKKLILPLKKIKVDSLIARKITLWIKMLTFLHHYRINHHLEISNLMWCTYISVHNLHKQSLVVHTQLHVGRWAAEESLSHSRTHIDQRPIFPACIVLSAVISQAPVVGPPRRPAAVISRSHSPMIRTDACPQTLAAPPASSSVVSPSAGCTAAAFFSTSPSPSLPPAACFSSLLLPHSTL